MNDDWFSQYTETKAPDSLGQEEDEGKREMHQQGDREGGAALFGRMDYADNHQKFSGSQHVQPERDWKEAVTNNASLRLQQYSNLESDMLEAVETKSPQIPDPGNSTDNAEQVEQWGEEPNKFRVQQQCQEDEFQEYEQSKSDYVQQNQPQVQQGQTVEQVRQQVAAQEDEEDEFGEFEQQTIGKNQSQNNVQPQQNQREQYRQIQTVAIQPRVNISMPTVAKKDELATLVDSLTDYSPLFLQAFIS